MSTWYLHTLSAAVVRRSRQRYPHIHTHTHTHTHTDTQPFSFIIVMYMKAALGQVGEFIHLYV